MLIGAREGDTRQFDAHGLPELRLAGLRAADAGALLDGALPAVVREDLVGATGGNPLALLELPGALSDDERSGRAPLRLDLPLNERIERAFMVRVEPLGDDARRLLVLAAADDSGDVGTLLRASERLGFGPDALDVAERAGLLTAEGTRLRFRHPLVRSAVYRAAGFAERRAAHEALAAVLDDDADVDRRAWHRAAAATAPDDEAAEALALTADHAASRGGHTAAARALERAAELDSDPQRRAAAARGGRRLLGAGRPRSAMPWRCSIVPSPSCATRWRAAPRRGCAAWCRWPSGARRTRTRCWPTPRARCCRPIGPPGSGC